MSDESQAIQKERVDYTAKFQVVVLQNFFFFLFLSALSEKFLSYSNF